MPGFITQYQRVLVNQGVMVTDPSLVLADMGPGTINVAVGYYVNGIAAVMAGAEMELVRAEIDRLSARLAALEGGGGVERRPLPQHRKDRLLPRSGLRPRPLYAAQRHAAN